MTAVPVALGASHRLVALTDAGQRLFENVTDGCSRILVTAREIGRAACPDHVTLLVSTAFATWWMMPRLVGFRMRHPRVDLRLETLDKDLEIASEATSLAVRRGTGRWPGYASALIAHERLVAVASPAMTRRVGRLDAVGADAIAADPSRGAAPLSASLAAILCSLRSLFSR